MDSDYLIIGSGIAGLSMAIRVAVWGTVVIVTKKGSVDTATNLAQGGIAAVLGEDDCLEAHLADTLEAGAGLCDLNVARMVVNAGKDRVNDLVSYGVPFVRDTLTGGLSLGREGGHSQRRVAHAYDLTGREIERALLEEVRQNPNIILLEDAFAVDLLIEQRERKTVCFGAYVMKGPGRVEPFTAPTTVLCTGGAGKVYLYTSNPDIATGDGVAMAARAGALVANMEFVQFHPTCLYHPEAKNFLISEAVRGEGALLVDRRGNRFMPKYDPKAELATRDVVARSIDREMKESGADCVYLDISHKKKTFLTERFPGIYKKCLQFGIDMSAEPLPVVPAAHYLCGGVLVDTWGNSSIAGLMALGETSCTGLHGANRLASNSLLEAVVYASRAADYCGTNVGRPGNEVRPAAIDPWSHGKAAPLEEEVLISHDWDIIRRTMWNYVGIVRSDKRLGLAQKRLLEVAAEIENHYRSYYVSPHMVELRNIAHLALMIVESAVTRKESRGLHYTLDHPELDDRWRQWIVLKRRSGELPWCLEVSRHQFTTGP